MSVATSLSRVTGFVRTWATAFALGATPLAASYSVANNIPNMIFELVAGGILSSLFIPTFMELREREGEQRAWRFASHVLNLSVLSLGVVAIVGVLLPQPFIWTQTFRLPSEGAESVRRLAEFFFRFFALQVVFYGGGMVIQGLLNAQRKYLWTALGPVFNNLVVIGTMLGVAAIGATTARGLVILAAGTTLGVVTMFAVMVPDLARSGVRYTPELGLRDPAVRRMLVLAIPTVVYVVTNLVAVSFRNASAFAVAENGPSVLMYAWNFYQLPYGILAVALATAVFTELSEAAGRRDMDTFRRHLGSGLRTTGVLVVPSAAALIALAEPLVSLYRVGAFDEASVAPVTSALRWWGVSLVFFASMMFVLRAFYSLKDTRTPAVVNLAFAALHIGLYWVLSTGVGGWPGLGVDGIPISDALFYAVMLVTLAELLRRKVGGYGMAQVLGTYGRMLVGSVLGGAAAFVIATAVADAIGGLSGSVAAVAAGGIACFGIALLVGRLLGVAEISIVGTLASKAAAKLTRRR